MRFNIDSSELKEFRAVLESLDGNFKKALRNALSKPARAVCKKANAYAKQFGWSGENVYVVGEAKKSKKSDSSCVILVGTKKVKITGARPKKNLSSFYQQLGDHFYLKFPEVGTIKQKPKPALRRALGESQNLILETLRVQMLLVVSKLLKKESLNV